MRLIEAILKAKLWNRVVGKKHKLSFSCYFFFKKMFNPDSRETYENLLWLAHSNTRAIGRAFIGLHWCNPNFPTVALFSLINEMLPYCCPLRHKAEIWEMKLLRLQPWVCWSSVSWVTRCKVAVGITTEHGMKWCRDNWGLCAASAHADSSSEGPKVASLFFFFFCLRPPMKRRLPVPLKCCQLVTGLPFSCTDYYKSILFNTC